MLQIKNISKYFNSKLVLDEISFDIPKGKIFGIIGPNGAGKTTTLRIILGILNPSSGEVFFENNLISQNFMNITGYLPEERGLYPKSNIVNTLVYLGQLKGLSHSDAINSVNHWLEKLDLLEYKKFTIEELSKGNQQKIQFVSAILHNPKILILDEPFSGFDPVNQSIFREIIETLKKDCYIILSTHLMDLAESLCDEIFLINDGRKVLSGNVNSLLNNNSQNIYEIYSEDIVTVKNKLSVEFNVLNTFSNYLTIDFGKNKPNQIIKRISELVDVSEIRKQKNSLNSLFLSLIEKSNV